MTLHGRPKANAPGVFTLLWVLLLHLAVPGSPALAQDRDADFDPHPLRSPDVSSPRDTLNSFLTDAHRAVDEFLSGGFDADTRRAYVRAAETFDFSDTPDGGSWSVRDRTMVYLLEILDRIDLPPEDQIPGDAEVADGTITHWTIPNTRITIARVEEGLKAGAYLFSADTVQRLDRLYRHSQHLTYKPGTDGDANEALLLLMQEDRVAMRVRNRLRGVDLSDPRSTLLTFLNSVNQAYALATEAEAALTASPPTMTRAEALAAEARADNLLERARSTLDLSAVPAALRNRVGVELAMQLKEILDRMLLPWVSTVPNARSVDAARRGDRGPFAGSTGPLRWRLPDTSIEIVEIVEGGRQGDFLFSAYTVSRLPTYYRDVKTLPYRDDDAYSYSAIDLEYPHPGITKGLYEDYNSTPGHLVPHAHFLGGIVGALPDWMKRVYGQETLWQWLALAVSMLAVAVAGYVIYRLDASVARRLRPPLGHWSKILVPVATALVVLSAARFLDRDITISARVMDRIDEVSGAIVVLMWAWAAFALFNAVAESIGYALSTHDTSSADARRFDASLVRIAARLLGIVVGAWIVIDGIQELGADVVPLLAGLGVGGLAVALAIRPTLENLIGGLILYADRPIRVGDFCTFGTFMGEVEHIGVRSTQVRGRDRTLISIPNAKFVDMELVNWAACDKMLINSTIGVRYETDPDQLRYLLVKIREMAHAHPSIDRETVRIRFAGYGDSSLNINVRIYALTNNWNEWYAIREDVFLRINDIVRDAGSSFAFPSRTVYMGQDDGLAEERKEAAIREVASWRESSKLPFPRLSDETMDELHGTLDYPPRGSVQGGPERLSARENDEDRSDEPRSRRNQPAPGSQNPGDATG